MSAIISDLPSAPKAVRLSHADIFLSTAPARVKDRRLALGVVLLSVLAFALAAPFAKQPMAQVWAFLPTYQAILVINDLITAAVLFGQYSVMRTTSLLVLACGYLFCALMAIAHALSFPGLFAPAGLLHAGPQTTAWLYFIWHGLFPLAVIAYALLRDRESSGSRGATRRAMIWSIAATVALAAGIVLLTTAGHDLLPPIMSGDRDLGDKVFVASFSWVLCVAAMPFLWRRRPFSVLDLWLSVVMCVWIFEIALAAVLNSGRFDFGWYAGRVYGLAAGSFVLFVLLLENGVLFARLAEAYKNLGEANRELEAFSYSVSHDLRSPLRAIDGYARMLEEDYADKFDEEGGRILGVVRDEALRMGGLVDGLLRYSRTGRLAMSPAEIDTDEIVDNVLAVCGREYDFGKITIERTPLPKVHGDPMLLRQVWENLIGNALKYSARCEHPRIVISGESKDGMHVFRIQDNGVGFDAAYKDKLFGVFQRLHTDDEFPGTGVGLAIAQKVVTRHDGRIWADSIVNEGATFCFSLPAGNRRDHEP
ncbi:MAG TPA: MASE4 domain-containing protein [Burkholderiales bacterium]